jgi:hypothetical protein
MFEKVFDFFLLVEELLHEIQMYSQITPLEIEILFQLVDSMGGHSGFVFVLFFVIFIMFY